MTSELNNLVTSVEHAEAILSRMEKAISITEHQQSTNEILGMHRFIMKVYAVVITVCVFSIAVGASIVMALGKDTERHIVVDQVKYESLVNDLRVNSEQNKMMITHLIAIQEETLKAQNRKK